MAAAIETASLKKAFRLGTAEVEVLKGINISIECGEFVSIMGSSGSGKSTLLYLMGALDKPTSGSIRILEKELKIMNDTQESVLRRKNIGFVFQFYNLIPNLNVEENILLPILLDGQNAKEKMPKLAEILKVVGLSDKRKHTPRELSGGEQQRVAVARALINEPEIILADEPIGNLDSKTGTGIMELFKEINREKGKTIVQVTHSSEAATYGQRTIFLKDGMVS